VAAVPQLACDEQLLPRHHTLGQQLSQRSTNLQAGRQAGTNAALSWRASRCASALLLLLQLSALQLLARDALPQVRLLLAGKTPSCTHDAACATAGITGCLAREASCGIPVLAVINPSLYLLDCQ
jgi:hypothetical protein